MKAFYIILSFSFLDKKENPSRQSKFIIIYGKCSKFLNSSYSKYRNFRKDLFLLNFADAKFRENKTLAKSLCHLLM